MCLYLILLHAVCVNLEVVTIVKVAHRKISLRVTFHGVYQVLLSLSWSGAVVE